MELLERLLADWPAKILSLAGAIALSYFYQINKLEERPMSVPLVVVTNDDFVPASQYPRTVRLVLRGESNAIYAVLEGDIEATLDLRGYTGAGVWRVPVRVEKRGSALGIDRSRSASTRPTSRCRSSRVWSRRYRWCRASGATWSRASSWLASGCRRPRWR